MSKAKTAQHKREENYIQSVFDKNEPFDIDYYFKTLRTAGVNPRLKRMAPEQHVVYVREFNCDRKPYKRLLMLAVEDWAQKSDPSSSQRNDYLCSFVCPEKPILFEISLGQSSAPRVTLTG